MHSTSVRRMPGNAPPGGGAHLDVLLIDDHPLFRAGLRMAFERQDGRIAFREAPTISAAMHLLAKGQHVDLIVYDWHLPGGSGVRGLIALTQLVPGVPVVVISGDADEASIRAAALASGAVDFLPKDMEASAFVAALRRRLESLPAADSSLGLAPHPPALTDRQLQVLECMARGLPNKHIARHLDIEETTVKAHVSEILRALHATNRTEAVVAALQAGLVRIATDGIAPSA